MAKKSTRTTNHLDKWFHQGIEMIQNRLVDIEAERRELLPKLAALQRAVSNGHRNGNGHHEWQPPEGTQLARVFAAMPNKPVAVSDLATFLKLPTGKVSSALQLLQKHGVVESEGRARAASWRKV